MGLGTKQRCTLFLFFLISAKDAGITVMNEIGLDPGIDHLYAVKTIEEVHKEGGKVSIIF